MAQQCATAISLVVLTAVLSTASKNTVTAFHVAFLTAAGFVLVGGILSLVLIHDTDAAATLVGAKVERMPS